jgi:DNA-directed RNA polymerase omega subunit
MMFIAPEKIGSKYRFVNLCAQRTRQILDGAVQRVDLGVNKPAFVAMQEVLADKVEWTVKETVEPELPQSGEILQVEVGP